MELIERIGSVDWFSNVGHYEDNEREIAIPSLAAWDDMAFSPDLDKNIVLIAANMDWLPTTRDQEDPINGNTLKEALHTIADGKKLVMDAYRLTTKSLRAFDKEKLKSGPHDYSEAAKGAALYCVRMTAIESLTNKPGFWTNLFDLYSRGYWPCGIMNDGVIVVY